MPTKAKNRESQQVAIRLPHELLARIDGYLPKLQKEHAGLGLEFGRADAIRALLTQALDALGPRSRPR